MNQNLLPPLTEATMLPPFWLTLPFVLLLVMIATGPLLFPHFWHKYYAKIALSLATFVVAYYCSVLHNSIQPIETAAEYLQFIALITALYIVTSGIVIQIHANATPAANLLLLLVGALSANCIGTTGASMLLIRPYIRFNKHRIKAYHIIFFIFIVSNIGGALTPIGDPPLFLGFLKGVPFTWTLIHNSFPWLIAVLIMLGVFYFLDKKNKIKSIPLPTEQRPILSIQGSKNFIWLAVVIGSVFLDPTTFTWLPVISYHGHVFSFIREGIMLITALLAYRSANKKILKANAFSFEPLQEVCFIFVGIFGTMMPALALIRILAQSEWAKPLITPTTLYWGTGIFSSILDNAPTYLNFTAASMAAQGADIARVAHVQAYAAGGSYAHSVIGLRAISLASVFFGAMTYIGNGPNFMVKSIAEKAGIPMPSFGHYITQFSLPFLLPILFIIWLLFFAFST
ncbi:MAG: sodium:proton antiporter [Candidatus Cardinium sp.]|nr:sodium:proton antiporter [Candidatus Cardinium sp.]